MSAVQAAALVFVVAVLLWAGRLLAAALRSPRCRAPAPSDTTPAAGASLPLPSAAAGGAVLESIVVYPVKGCKGVEMREAKLTPLGLEHDREWMVVNAAGTCVDAAHCHWPCGGPAAQQAAALGPHRSTRCALRP